MRAPGTGGPSTAAPVCHGSRSQPGRGQVQTASGLLTALPARRPLKRKREGETARAKKESALLGRAAGANHRGRGASGRSPRLSGSRTPLRPSRSPPAPAPAPRAIPGLDSRPAGSRRSPPHTPTPAPPRDSAKPRRGLPNFCGHPLGLARWWSARVLCMAVLKSRRDDCGGSTLVSPVAHFRTRSWDTCSKGSEHDFKGQPTFALSFPPESVHY